MKGPGYDSGPWSRGFPARLMRGGPLARPTLEPEFRMPETPDSSGVDLFRLAVDLSPSGMLAVDQAGTILLVNREIERLFGYRREELLGKPLELLVPDRFRAGHPGFRNQYFADPRSRPMGVGRDLFGLRKDGSEVPVEIGLNPVRMPGRIVVLASVVDISARK